MNDARTARNARAMRDTPARAADSASPSEDRSVGTLLRELADESRTLLREEVTLAKTEVAEKIHVYRQNGVRVGIGAALLLAALLFLLWAVNIGLTALFASFLPPGIAVWLAPLVLAAVLGMIGWGMVQEGSKAIGREGVVPRDTLETLKEDKNWVQEKVR